MKTTSSGTAWFNRLVTAVRAVVALACLLMSTPAAGAQPVLRLQSRFFMSESYPALADQIADPGYENWASLGGGMNGVVRALVVDAAGNLYAGGDFTSAGGVNANRIAQ